MRLPILLCVIALSLGASTGNAASTRELRVGIGLTKPPYIMASGKTGLEYEIIEKALSAAGYKMVAQPYPPARSLALLRAGLLDAMITVNEGIGDAGHFSDDYIVYRNVAITLAERNIALHSAQDLANYSIAAFQNARLILSPEYAAAVEGHPDYKEYPQQITQNKLLYSGRVDVVISDRLIFRYLSREINSGAHADLDPHQEVTIHTLFPATPHKAVFRDAAARDAFNNGLRTIRQNGTYGAILKKYSTYLVP